MPLQVADIQPGNLHRQTQRRYAPGLHTSFLRRQLPQAFFLYQRECRTSASEIYCATEARPLPHAPKASTTTS